jgi:hypothetical protein
MGDWQGPHFEVMLAEFLGAQCLFQNICVQCSFPSATTFILMHTCRFPTGLV